MKSPDDFVHMGLEILSCRLLQG